MKPVGHPHTVGELRKMLETLPDDMALHGSGSMGQHPPGVIFVIRRLAAAKSDPNYFADVEHDTVWSRPQYRDDFGQSRDTLCVF